MDKIVVRYPRRLLYLIFIPVYCIALAWIAFLVFSGAPSIIGCILVSIIGLVLIVPALNNAFKIITLTDNEIIIATPLKQMKCLWSEISEFGRQRQRTGVPTFWSYYIKSAKLGDKKFWLGTSKFDNSDVMVQKIFEKANKAKFVELRIAIPFMGKLTATQWEHKDWFFPLG